MKKISIIACLLIAFTSIHADEYSSNKRYSFEEVAEILSEKIIQDREKIVKLENEVEELKMQIKNSENGVLRKLGETNRTLSDVKETQFKNNIRTSGNSERTVNNVTMKNIEISTELYNKVK